jgi:hypothetical protein
VELTVGNSSRTNTEVAKSKLTDDPVPMLITIPKSEDELVPEGLHKLGTS